MNIKSGKGLLVYECITDRRIWKPDQQFDCEIKKRSLNEKVNSTWQELILRL